ncbi:MAG: hypothetical protein QGI09_08075, partial [Dehalococcoidia bacterium]|nr:hypothetical protein [Dehalococcoidia bacterium]
MSEELNEILRSPRDAAFSRIRYVARYASPEQMSDFLRGLYLKAVEAKDAQQWDDLASYLDEWESWAMSTFNSHRGTLTVEDIPWAPVSKPLNQSRVALLTTGGIYVAGQEP